MKWIDSENVKVPVKSWCAEIEESAKKQAKNLANHPAVFKHVALMPDCHTGKGVPIGGVVACENAVIPNAVGVDIGCGMAAVQTDFPVEKIKGNLKLIRSIMDYIKEKVPVGEGNAHKNRQYWSGLSGFLTALGFPGEISDFKDPALPPWLDKHGWMLDGRNLGTLGGGNHFIELQEGDDGFLWLMLHSGSRNLGHRIASYYHNKALELNKLWHVQLPDAFLAFLPASTEEGQAYIRDMNFALEYAKENRKRMMSVFKEALAEILKDISFTEEINIHHNYASLEKHFGQNVWVHRKGATSAKKGEKGIIPGSMGTNSYIVEGQGNPESFTSCSHGAGRKMSRTKACAELTVEECNTAMEGIVFDRWKKGKKRRWEKKKVLDLAEAPGAYKDIDEVIVSELDLIKPLVKLQPLGVVKG